MTKTEILLKYKRHLESTGLAKATIRKYLSAARSWLKGNKRKSRSWKGAVNMFVEFTNNAYFNKPHADLFTQSQIDNTEELNSCTTRDCKHCNKSYKSKSKSSLYCSNKCRTYAHRAEKKNSDSPSITVIKQFKALQETGFTFAESVEILEKKYNEQPT